MLPLAKYYQVPFFFVTLIGLAQPLITKNILKNELWATDFFSVYFYYLNLSFFP